MEMQQINTQQNIMVNIMKRIEQKINFIEDEVITIKSWLGEDNKLSPSEKKLIDGTIRKVKEGHFTDMITLGNLKRKIGV